MLPARPIVSPFINLLPASAVGLTAAAAASQLEATPRDEIAPAALTPQPGWASIDLADSSRGSTRTAGSSARATATSSCSLPASMNSELVNESLKYRSSQSVVIQPGRATFISVDLPMGVAEPQRAALEREC